MGLSHVNQRMERLNTQPECYSLSQIYYFHYFNDNSKGGVMVCLRLTVNETAAGIYDMQPLVYFYFYEQPI